jgi:probable blue pigment (indigoidine) exporter
VLSKYALDAVDASVLFPFQLTCSVLLLGAFLLVSGSTVRGIEHSLEIAALGVLNPGIAYVLGLTGLAQIEASMSVVIWATEPVLIVVLAFALLRERISLWSALCLASAMAGVALIVGTPSAGDRFTGVALTFLAVVACALYSILLRRLDLTDGTLPIVFLQQSSALAFAVVVLIVVSEQPLRAVIDGTPLHLASAILAGALYYGVAFLLYVAGLRRTSAHHAGMFLTLIPVFGVLFSALLLGERLEARQLLGSAVVVGSMTVLSTRMRGRRQASAEAETEAMRTAALDPPGL